MARKANYSFEKRQKELAKKKKKEEKRLRKQGKNEPLENDGQLDVESDTSSAAEEDTTEEE